MGWDDGDGWGWGLVWTEYVDDGVWYVFWLFEMGDGKVIIVDGYYGL